MKTIGLYEAKTRLSEICEAVNRSRRPVTLTRRGRPLVRIEPIDAAVPTIAERRREYMAKYGKREAVDAVDFEPSQRSRETVAFVIED